MKPPRTYLGRWRRRSDNTLVYLASPYSHPDPAVREERFQGACRAAAHLMQAGMHVFSPIAHTHPLLLASDLPTDWDFWEEYDEDVLSACRALAVLQLGGWDTSAGVQEEVEIAQRLELPTYYAGPTPESLDLLAKVVRRDFGEEPATHPLVGRRTSPGTRGRAA